MPKGKFQPLASDLTKTENLSSYQGLIVGLLSVPNLFENC